MIHIHFFKFFKSILFSNKSLPMSIISIYIIYSYFQYLMVFYAQLFLIIKKKNERPLSVTFLSDTMIFEKRWFLCPTPVDYASGVGWAG